jgi:hypothetical protein
LLVEEGQYIDHVGLMLSKLKLTCFYAGAVSLWAGNFGVGAVVVAGTVGCGGVLGKEFQLRENGC